MLFSQLFLVFIITGATGSDEDTKDGHVKWPVKSDSNEGQSGWKIHPDSTDTPHGTEHTSNPPHLELNPVYSQHQNLALDKSHRKSHHQEPVQLESHIPNHHAHPHHVPHYTQHQIPATEYPQGVSHHKPETLTSHVVHHYKPAGMQSHEMHHYGPAGLQPHVSHHYVPDFSDSQTIYQPQPASTGPYASKGYKTMHSHGGPSSQRLPKNARYTQQLEDGTWMTWGPADGGSGWWNGPGSGNPEDAPPEEGEEEEEAQQPARNYKRVGRALNIASGFLIILVNILMSSLILMAMGWSPDII